MHLAQINVGRLLHPLDDPRMADLVANLATINVRTEASERFAWRLKDETGHAFTFGMVFPPKVAAA